MPDRDLSDAPDELLVERSLDGDVRAFEVVLRRYSSMMRAYAARLMASSADADDAVQDAFIVAWDSLDTLSDPRAVKPWLMRIVSRKATDRLRRRKPTVNWEDREIPAPATSGPEHQTEVRTQMELVARLLGALPELQRQCWILKETAGYSYQEIADELETPLSTVRGAIARARQTLIRGMEDWT